MSTEFNFNAIARREFDFLLNQDFRISYTGDNIVVYQSTCCKIAIYRDRDGVGLDFRSTAAELKNTSVPFKSLLRRLNKEAAAQLPATDMVANDAKAEERVTYLAGHFRRYVNLDALKSPVLFAELIAEGMEEFRRLYPMMSMEQLQARFQQMWNQQEYAALLNLFGPLSDALTDDERKKLDIARRVGKEIGHG